MLQAVTPQLELVSDDPDCRVDTNQLPPEWWEDLRDFKIAYQFTRDFFDFSMIASIKEPEYWIPNCEDFVANGLDFCKKGEPYKDMIRSACKDNVRLSGCFKQDILLLTIESNDPPWSAWRIPGGRIRKFATLDKLGNWRIQPKVPPEFGPE